MRISDWSSDVCSSDLGDRLAECHHGAFLALVLERDGRAGHLQIVVALRGLQRLDRLRRDRCVEDRTKFALRGVFRVVRDVLHEKVSIQFFILELRIDRKSDVSGKSVTVRVDLVSVDLITKKTKSMIRNMKN